MLVVYDSMQNYASALVRYLSQKNTDIRMAAFSDRAAFQTYCAAQVPDVILMDEQLADDEICQIPCGTRILLSEQSGSIKCGDDGMMRIGRYQSADEILSLILLCCSSMPVKEAGGKDPSELISFYTPSGSGGSPSPAWGYARGKDALYLSLYENAGFSQHFQRQYKRDLSDLLYLNMHHAGDFGMLLRSVTVEDEGVRYIPPMEQAKDAFEVSEKDWSEFLRQLKYESGYTQIIFDLEFLFPAAYGILEQSEAIYLVLQGNGEMQSCRTKHFLLHYEKRFGRKALEKLKKADVIRQEAVLHEEGGFYAS